MDNKVVAFRALATALQGLVDRGLTEAFLEEEALGSDSESDSGPRWSDKLSAALIGCLPVFLYVRNFAVAMLKTMMKPEFISNFKQPDRLPGYKNTIMEVLFRVMYSSLTESRGLMFLAPIAIVQLLPVLLSSFSDDHTLNACHLIGDLSDRQKSLDIMVAAEDANIIASMHYIIIAINTIRPLGPLDLGAAFDSQEKSFDENLTTFVLALGTADLSLFFQRIALHLNKLPQRFEDSAGELDESVISGISLLDSVIELACFTMALGPESTAELAFSPARAACSLLSRCLESDALPALAGKDVLQCMRRVTCTRLLRAHRIQLSAAPQTSQQQQQRVNTRPTDAQEKAASVDPGEVQQKVQVTGTSLPPECEQPLSLVPLLVTRLTAYMTRSVKSVASAAFHQGGFVFGSVITTRFESLVIACTEASETAAATSAQLASATAALTDALTSLTLQKILEENTAWRDVPDMGTRTMRALATKKPSPRALSLELEALAAALQSRVERYLLASVAALRELCKSMVDIVESLAFEDHCQDGMTPIASSMLNEGQTSDIRFSRDSCAKMLSLCRVDWAALSTLYLSRYLDFDHIELYCGNLLCTGKSGELSLLSCESCSHQDSITSDCFSDIRANTGRYVPSNFY